MNDIIKNKRKLKDVLPKNSGFQIKKTPHKETNSSNSLDLLSRRSRIPKKFIWFFAILILVFGLITITSALSRATVNITPQVSVPFEIKGEFSAYLDPVDSDLAFYTVSNEQEVTKTVEPSGTETVTSYAEGDITIYNSSAEPQTLVERTRFESPDGKIFRIQKQVVVPGKTDEEPGQLTTKVIADEPGEAQNIEPTTFTVPGLAGGDLFDLITAKSFETFEGGQTGEVKVINEEDREQALTAIETELESLDLSTQVLSAPDGFILPDEAVISGLEYKTEDTNDGQVKIIGQKSYTGIMFNKYDLSKFLAKIYLGSDQYQGEDILLDDFSKLTFEIDNLEELNPYELDKIDFTLSSDNQEVKFIWVVDEESIRKLVAGSNKESFQQILKSSNTVGRAQIDFRPFWLKTVPENPDKIKIRIIYPE
ncbi:MAG: hypothetical protein ACOCU8_00180 [Patescibacteria group bacterium]